MGERLPAVWRESHQRAVVRFAAVALAFAIVASCSTPAVVASQDHPERAFASDSAWNVPIRHNPVLDPQSAERVAHISQEGRGYADLYESGLPIFDADASTPRVRVKCTKPWGTCELESGSVPIPKSAQPNSSTDAHMTVIDWSTDKVYEFWQAKKVNDREWTTSWGGVVDLRGEGTPGQARGSAVSLLAGVVRISEFMRGRIGHALVFTTDACSSEYRYPASQSDGTFPQPNCVPEGARMQLDPKIDVNKIPDITRGERIVATALQVYGAYAVDNGGAKIAFAFEKPTAGKPDPYPEAGFAWDYWHMPHIPWNRLRVLNRWDGS